MLDTLDHYLSKQIYDLFNRGTFVSSIPHLFGLFPYELYVLPGMYIAILQTPWFGTPNPIQFHLLPHWFAYSIFQLLKHTVKRKRPGCFHKDMNKFIHPGHCKNGVEFQSFPSGHTGVAFSLAAALWMEMNYSNHSQFFEINITKQETKSWISGLGLAVASMVAIQRVSKGYHSFFDVLIGAIIGASIGFVSWSSLEFYKKRYQELCEKHGKEEEELCENHEKSTRGKEHEYWIQQYNIFKTKLSKDPFLNRATGFVRLLLTIPIVYLLAKFFLKDIFHLTAIQH